MDEIIKISKLENNTFRQVHNELDEWLENLRLQETAIHYEELNKKLSKYDVIDIRNDNFYKIWSIRNDKTGFPHFLIYDAGAWKWQSAKHFKPIQEV